jgi:hypothetical protein
LAQSYSGIIHLQNRKPAVYGISFVNNNVKYPEILNFGKKLGQSTKNGTKNENENINFQQNS